MTSMEFSLSTGHLQMGDPLGALALKVSQERKLTVQGYIVESNDSFSFWQELLELKDTTNQIFKFPWKYYQQTEFCSEDNWILEDSVYELECSVFSKKKKNTHTLEYTRIQQY